MPHLFDEYWPNTTTRHKVLKLAKDFDLLPSTVINLRVRFALQAAETWEELEPEIAARWYEEIINMKQIESKLNQKHTNGITDEQIAIAKEYPIDRLIEFTRGKATAWCHDDKTPSLHHHRQANRAHCFPCGKSYNPIDVLMQRDNMSFIDAVRALQ
jgi:hypothetical protein